MTEQEQLTKVIGNTWLVDFEGNTHDVEEVLDNVEISSIARELLEQGYHKLPENSAVLSREEYEQHANEYKNLSIKYDQISDKYRLCKDANEKLKQKAISASKETARKILDYFDRYAGTGEKLIGNMISEQRKKYGVEVDE